MDDPPREVEPTWILQSLTSEATWTHICVDFAIMIGAMLAGMLVYVLVVLAQRVLQRSPDRYQKFRGSILCAVDLRCAGASGILAEPLRHGSPWTLVELDIENLDVKNPMHCYTEEEAVQKYGPDEGQGFGDEFQICGQRLPKMRALKYAVHSGPKVAEVFKKLSYEEKHALMNGMASLPEDFMQTSLREHYRGSNLAMCDGCKATPAGKDGFEEGYEACPRCEYTACKECKPDYKLGRCYCLNSNFGVDYPAPSRRAFHQTGIW